MTETNEKTKKLEKRVMKLMELIQKEQTSLRKLPWKVDPSAVNGDFELCWRKMCEDLKNTKTFSTTGGTRNFEVWSVGFSLYYNNSKRNVCPLSKSDFKKAYEIFKENGDLSSSTYQFTRHGSYIPPLLYEYFVTRKN